MNSGSKPQLRLLGMLCSASGRAQPLQSFNVALQSAGGGVLIPPSHLWHQRSPEFTLQCILTCTLCASGMLKLTTLLCSAVELQGGLKSSALTVLSMLGPGCAVPVSLMTHSSTRQFRALSCAVLRLAVSLFLEMKRRKIRYRHTEKMHNAHANAESI